MAEVCEYSHICGLSDQLHHIHWFGPHQQQAANTNQNSLVHLLEGQEVRYLEEDTLPTAYSHWNGFGMCVCVCVCVYVCVHVCACVCVCMCVCVHVCVCV